MRPFSKIASVIFGIIALLHLARVITSFPVALGNYELPVWVSVAGVVIAIVLCLGLWKESNQE